MSTVGSSSITTPTPPSTDLRLPRSVLPMHYDLTVEPNHKTNQFSGEVFIQLNVSEPTDTIKIHSYLLTVDKITVSDTNGQQLDINDTDYDESRQYHVIQLSSQLGVGAYQLSMSFNGSLIGKIIGFYKNSYTNPQNQIRWIKSFSKVNRKNSFKH